MFAGSAGSMTGLSPVPVTLNVAFSKGGSAKTIEIAEPERATTENNIIKFR